MKCLCSEEVTLNKFDILHDIWTVSSSFIDIITDILVTYEFYQNGHMVFFYLSMIIFMVAQFSYAWIFAETWGKHASPLRIIFIFIIILPFAQLIPIFTWLESFHFDIIDKFLLKISLVPTSNDPVPTTTTQRSENDLLWNYIQKKCKAHLGFLAEAFFEAIPQGILQTVAILTLNTTSTLNIFSIFLSITVVASKGYLVSYSLHRPSFIFNYLTIATDLFLLFASVTWLYVDIPGLSKNPLIRFPFLCIPTVLSMSCFLFITFWTVCYTIFEDHICSTKDHLKQFDGIVIMFELYLLRLFGWCLSIIPSCVIHLTGKFTYLPLIVFDSLNPEHAIHVNFYKPLFQFLNGNVTQEMSQFLDLSHLRQTQQQEQHQLSENLRQEAGKQSPQQSPSCCLNVCYRYLRRDRSCQTVHPTSKSHQNSNLSQQSEPRFGVLDRQVRLEVTNNFLEQAWIGVPPQVGNDQIETDRPGIIPMLKHEIEVLFADLKKSWADYNKGIYYELYKNPDDPRWQHDLHRIRPPSYCFICFQSYAYKRKYKRKLIGLLRMIFRACMLISTILQVFGIICWVPLYLFFMVCSIIFPLTQMHRCIPSEQGDDNLLLLPCVLSSTYIACLFGLIVLSPFVARFQLIRSDLRSAKGLPDEFFTIEKVKDIFRRYLAVKARQEVNSVLLLKMNQYNKEDVLSYLKESHLNIAYV